MKNRLIIFCLLILFGALHLQIQPVFSGASNPDTNSKKAPRKIAIAAVGNSINSKISLNAGKAPYYLIFDENGVLLKSIKNPGQSSGHRSSSAVVNLLLKESCQTVVAGNFGEKMQNQLKAYNIECYKREGIVKNVLQTLQPSNKKIQRKN